MRWMVILEFEIAGASIEQSGITRLIQSRTSYKDLPGSSPGRRRMVDGNRVSQKAAVAME